MQRPNFLHQIAGIVAVCLCVTAASSAAGEPADEPAVVAATVDGEPITAEDVARSLREAYGRRPIDEAARPLYEARALATIVRQRLVERRLARDKLAAPPDQVDRELERLRLAAAGKYDSFEQYLAAAGHSEESLRRLAAWRIGWKRYLNKHVNDAAREAYFDAHRAEFDGTQMRVAHILLPVDGEDRERSLAARLDEARRLRERIAAEELSFAAAAEQYSTGPSRAKGGDLGWIARRGDMSEEFSRAAFALKPGEVSPPVVSRFGVHLIQCTDLRPGERTWTEARDEMEPHVLQVLFDRVAAEELPKAKVEYTGRMPYLDPETGELRPNGD